MQISGFPILIPPASQAQRPDAVERSQKDIPRDGVETDERESNSLSFEDIQDFREDVIPQRVESSSQSSTINASRQQSGEQFPLNIQKALQAFADNTPTPEQQLGIELVGVDTFA